MNLKDILFKKVDDRIVKPFRIAIFSYGMLTGLFGIYVAGRSEPINPPAWYEEEWRKVAEWFDIEPRPLKYYKIKGEDFPCPPNFWDVCKGMYVFGNHVFLSEKSLSNKKLLRHELIHAAGIFNHEGIYYTQNCMGYNDLRQKQNRLSE